MSFNPDNIDISKITFGMMESPGIKYLNREMVDFEEIHCPPMKDNPTRTNGKKNSHINMLAQSLSTGIDYSKQPPVLIKLSHAKFEDGKVAKYDLIAGNHRFEAMRSISFDKWVFDIIEIDSSSRLSYDDIIRTFQLRENNHAPALGCTENDVVVTVVNLIKKNSSLVGADESSIKSYVSTNCSNMHVNTQNKIVKDVIRNLQSDGFGDWNYYVWTPQDANEQLERFGLKGNGNYDENIDEIGRFLQEGQELNYLGQAINMNDKLDKRTYFTCATNSPTEKESIVDKRIKMENKLDNLWQTYVRVVHKYDETGIPPYRVHGYLGQDLSCEDPNEYILKE